MLSLLHFYRKVIIIIGHYYRKVIAFYRTTLFPASRQGAIERCRCVAFCGRHTNINRWAITGLQIPTCNLLPFPIQAYSICGLFLDNTDKRYILPHCLKQTASQRKYIVDNEPHQDNSCSILISKQLPFCVKSYNQQPLRRCHFPKASRFIRRNTAYLPSVISLN